MYLQLGRVCALFFLLILTGCHTFKEISNEGPFEGIAHSIERESEVSIFILHGMNGFSSGEPYCLINGLKSSLCLSPDGEPSYRMIENGGKRYGWLRREQFISEGDCDSAGKRVNIYSLDWREVTANPKKFLRWLDLTLEYKPEMAKFVEDAKSKVVDMGLGDIALYLGEYSSEICYPVKQALRWICKDTERTGKRHELICVTMSFGGVILMDTLDSIAGVGDVCCRDGDADGVCRKVVEEISGIFVLSNPIPLFLLNRDKPEITSYIFNDRQPSQECDCCNHQIVCDPPCPDRHWRWEVENLGQFLREKQSINPEFRVIAVTDPNDIFSYPGYGVAVRGSDGVVRDMFTTAYVRNVKKSVFGFIDPRKAHSNYGRNCQVIDMISYGLRNCCDE